MPKLPPQALSNEVNANVFLGGLTGSLRPCSKSVINERGDLRDYSEAKEMQAMLSERPSSENNRDDIIRMAREAGYQPLDPPAFFDCLQEVFFVRFAALVAAAEREILVNWMRQHGFSTGQAYTTDSLLDRLGTEMVENVDAAVLAEREACAKLCDEVDDGREDLSAKCAEAIRARGEK